jgi:transposase
LPARFRAWILDQLTLIADQQKRIKELESRLRQDSTNSSRPPSTDLPWTAKTNPAKKRAKSKRKPKRKPGGQPGHELHERPLVPPEEVDEHKDLRPEQCEACDRHLPGRLPSVDEPRRHQVVEIPEITYWTTEYVQHGVVCPNCNTTTYASLPHGVSPSSFGPNLRAFIGLLSGRYRTSRREVAELLHDVLGISISVGAVDNTCRRLSEALKEPVNEVAARVKEAPVAHMDETGWRQKGQRMWLWVVATTYAVLFHIGTRCKGEAIELLGPDFQGKLVSDRYAVYYQFEADRRQVCCLLSAE